MSHLSESVDIPAGCTFVLLQIYVENSDDDTAHLVHCVKGWSLELGIYFNFMIRKNGKNKIEN